MDERRGSAHRQYLTGQPGTTHSKCTRERPVIGACLASTHRTITVLQFPLAAADLRSLCHQNHCRQYLWMMATMTMRTSSMTPLMWAFVLHLNCRRRY